MNMQTTMPNILRLSPPDILGLENGNDNSYRLRLRTYYTIWTLAANY